jgi:hypothetical protein
VTSALVLADEHGLQRADRLRDRALQDLVLELGDDPKPAPVHPVLPLIHRRTSAHAERGSLPGVRYPEIAEPGSSAVAASFVVG